MVRCATTFWNIQCSINLTHYFLILWLLINFVLCTFEHTRLLYTCPSIYHNCLEPSIFHKSQRLFLNPMVAHSAQDYYTCFYVNELRGVTLKRKYSNKVVKLVEEATRRRDVTARWSSVGSTGWGNWSTKRGEDDARPLGCRLGGDDGWRCRVQ